MTAPDPTTPNDTPNMIGSQPTESADDVTGLTAQVTAPGALATVVTVVQRTMNSADQVPKSVGLIYWHPVSDNFTWYGVVDGGSTP